MLFSILKFIHIVAAIVWVGGVITTTLLNIRISTTRNIAAIAEFASVAGFAGQWVFGPAAALTLLAGIATALTAGFQMRSLWIIWGFAAILLSLALGATLIRTTISRLIALTASAKGADTQVAALQKRLWIVSALNILLLLSAVWAMVAKPGG